MSSYTKFLNVDNAILRGETFVERKFCEVRNSRNFRDKLSRMISNDAFRENITFANDYFNW